MKCILYKGTSSVMRIEITLTESFLFVIDYAIIEPAKLPVGLKRICNVDRIKGCDILTQWLINRCIPDYRIGLDEFCFHLYHLNQAYFGRMYGHQLTGAMLSYFSSGFDDYLLAPYRINTICHVLTEPQFWNLYQLLPLSDRYNKENEKSFENVFDSKDLVKYNGFWKTNVFTIPSRFPSWWSGKKLIQKYDDEYRDSVMNFHNIANQVELAGERSIEEGKLITDFSKYEEIEVTWFGEYIQFAKTEKDIKNMIIEDFGDMIAEKIYNILDIMKKKEYQVAIYEIGMMKHKNGVEIIGMI